MLDTRRVSPWPVTHCMLPERGVVVGVVVADVVSEVVGEVVIVNVPVVVSV